MNLKILRKYDLKDQESNIFVFKSQNYITLNLLLTPNKWSGQGVLGCRFKPL